MNPSETWPPPTTLATTLAHGLRRQNPKSIAQVEVETGRELTFSHLTRLSFSAVQGLKKRGISESSLVLVVTYNSQEAHVILLATILLGATVSVLDPSLTTDEMCYLIDIVKPDIVYSEGGKTLKKVEAAFANLDLEPVLIVSGKSANAHTSFKELLEPTDPDFQPSTENPVKHTAMVLFTSGTSGIPKGVRISDYYFLYLFKIAGQLIFKRTDNDEKSISQTVELSTSPLFWISGVIQLFFSILSGSKRIFFRGSAKEEVLLCTIQNFKVNGWTTSPSVLMKLTLFKKKNDYDLSSLTGVSCGGAALTADLQLRIIREVFRNKTPIVQSYGMTEIGVVVTSFLGIKPGSCGKLLPGIQYKIADLDSGEALGSEAEGELCFKASHFMLGYFDDFESTRKVFDDDGWFHTGDIGYVDDDGFFFVVDRLKDLIKYRTYQIAPAEVEGVLQTHPAVRDCAVVGVPDPVDGEHAAAFIVRQAPVTEYQLLDYVSQRVSEYKLLRGGIIFLEAIPYTTTGKKKRRFLKTQLIIGLNSV